MKLFSLFLLIAMPAAIVAQPVLSIPYIESFDHPKVGVQLDVRCNGVKARDFKKENFTLFEDGKKIDNFSIYCPDSTDRCCLSLAIVMDATTSMMGYPPNLFDKYKKAQEAALQLVTGMDGVCDHASITRFGHGRDSLVVPWTRDTVALKNGILAPYHLWNGSPMYDAIASTIKQFDPDESDCMAIVLFTNSRDNWSSISLDSCARLARKHGIRIFFVHTAYHETPDTSYIELAAKTGGKVYSPFEMLKVDSVMTDLKKTIRTHFGTCQLQYTSPACTDGFPHTLEVVLGKPDPFCATEISARTSYTTYPSENLPRLSFSSSTLLLDPDSVGLLPVMLISDIDSVQVSLQNILISFDEGTFDVKRIIVENSLLATIPFTTTPIYKGYMLSLSFKKTIHLPALLCTLELAWKRKDLRESWLRVSSPTTLARCLFVESMGSRIRNKQLTSITEPAPADFTVSECYPNPVRASETDIMMTLQRREHVSVLLFDYSGRLLRSIADAEYDAGSHALSIETAMLPAGTYTVLLSIGDHTVQRRFVKAE